VKEEAGLSLFSHPGTLKPKERELQENLSASDGRRRRRGSFPAVVVMTDASSSTGREGKFGGKFEGRGIRMERGEGFESLTLALFSKNK
jgi:hypothetical protein